MPQRRADNQVLFQGAMGLFVFLIIFAIVNITLAALPLALNAIGRVSSNSLFYILNSTLSLSFAISSVLYLRLYKGISFSAIPKVLGLNRKSLSLRIVALGILLFLVVFILSEITTLVNAITNAQISSNVAATIGAAPIWFYLFSSLIVPINEEVLFRGIMVPRLGIVISAAIFATLHYSYGSWLEIVVAFVFAILAGYIFKRTKALYPSIFAHALVNSVTLLLPLL